MIIVFEGVVNGKSLEEDLDCNGWTILDNIYGLFSVKCFC